MKRSALTFLLSTLCACSVHNTVADDDRTPSEQLAADVSASCASICDWAAQCPAPPTCNCSDPPCSCAQLLDPATCPSECVKSMGMYQGHGDACASAGLGFLDCLSSATCANLYQEGLCAPSADATSSCGADTAGGSSGPVVPASTGSGGSANSGGSSDTAGTPTSSAPVRCETGYGSGVAGGGNIDGSFVSCEQGFEGCADGHSYYAVCVIGDRARSACSCFLDSTLQTSFTPSVECPALPEINAACHWSVQN